jgi:hypothetical protein
MDSSGSGNSSSHCRASIRCASIGIKTTWNLPTWEHRNRFITVENDDHSIVLSTLAEFRSAFAISRHPAINLYRFSRVDRRNLSRMGSRNQRYSIDYSAKPSRDGYRLMGAVKLDTACIVDGPLDTGRVDLHSLCFARIDNRLRPVCRKI